MFNKEVVVRCESGLHNKQATYFVQKANEFESSIWLESGSRKMNAKSLLGIMSLGIVTGSSVTLSAMGPDAEAAVNALDTLLQLLSISLRPTVTVEPIPLSNVLLIFASYTLVFFTTVTPLEPTSVQLQLELFSG